MSFYTQMVKLLISSYYVEGTGNIILNGMFLFIWNKKDLK